MLHHERKRKTAGRPKTAGALRKRALAVGAALLLLTAQCVPALASEPEFARSAEEWERLRDNTLEYDEIADLIHEYNATVQKNQYSYQEFIKDYGKTNSEVTEEYNDLANDLENDLTGGDDASSMIADLQLQLQIDQLREQADDATEDSESYRLTYEQAEKSLVVTAQSYMISYYEDQLAIENAQEELRLSEEQLKLQQAKLAAGMSTQTELLSCEQDVIDKKKALQESETSLESVRQKLIVMLGWSYDDTPEIGALPEVDESEIDAIDLSADIETALSNNYTLRINERKYANAKMGTTKDTLETTIADNKTQIGVTVKNAYNSLLLAKSELEQARSEETEAEEELRLTEKERAAGLITDYALSEKQSEVKSKQNAVKQAELSLLTALETYRWNVNGLAAAE